MHILMAICSVGYCISVIPQIKRVHNLKKADQLSWLYLGLTTVSLAVSVVALIMLTCYVTAFFCVIQTMGFLTLIGMKAKYGRRKT